MRTDIINLGLHSWHDFVTTAARRKTEPAISGSGSGTAVSRGKSWDDGAGFDGAVDMAMNGWQAGVQQIAVHLDKLPPESEVLPDWNLDVGGAICNVPAFIAGEPECMWRMSECKRAARRVVLAVSGIFAGSTSATAVMNYAVALAATVRYLEASGIDVAVYNVSNSQVDKPTIYGTVIKEFGEPLDLSKVAFAFHPAFLRRIGFAWREITPAACAAKICGQSYGAYGPPGGKLSLEEMNVLLGETREPIVLVRGFYDDIPYSGTVAEYLETMKADIKSAIV